MLASHREIHTLPEPWLMLELMGESAVEPGTPYNEEFAQEAVREFLQRTEQKLGRPRGPIRDTALDLYGRALEGRDESLFLDKTPRYYHIILQLIETFPDASFVFLLRNPLDVFASILDVNLGGNWVRLFSSERRHDILYAPEALLKGIETAGDRGVVVRYEALVSHPEEEVRKLLQGLGLEFESSVLSYGGKVEFEESSFRDPKSIYRHEGPVSDYVNSWPGRLGTRQQRQVALAYLENLGQATVEALGYPYESLVQDLRSEMTLPAVDWTRMVDVTEAREGWAARTLEVVNSLDNRGVTGTIGRIARELKEGTRR